MPDESTSQRSLYPGETPGSYAVDLPFVKINNRQLRDITSDALEALIAKNDPPRIFVRDGFWTRMEWDETGIPVIRPLTSKSLRHRLARIADWVQISRSQDQETLEWTEKRVNKPPPPEVVDDLLAFPEPPKDIPGLEGITTSPFWNGREIVRTGGYDPRSKWFLDSYDTWPEFKGTGQDAACWLLDELLTDFPFANEASKANALAMLVTAFMRPGLGSALVPMFFCDAPTPGSGKSLLIKICFLALTGRIPSAIPIPDQEAEFQKLLFSLLMEGRPVIFLDNLGKRLFSDSLDTALTAGTFGGRILGVSATATVKVRSVFALTANNGQLRTDTVRRSVWIRLDPHREDPEARTGFRHPNLIAWVTENRGMIAAAVGRMVEEWQEVGRIKGQKPKGTYEQWSLIVGGVLEACGVVGFLENDKDLKLAASPDEGEWLALMTEWWEIHRSIPITSKEIRELAETHDLLTATMGDGNDRARGIKLGKAIGKRLDKVLGEYRIEKSTMFEGAYRFKLTKSGETVNVSPKEHSEIPTDLFDNGGDTFTVSPVEPKSPVNANPTSTGYDLEDEYDVYGDQ